MKTENNTLIALSHFLGFRIVKMDNRNLALVRTRTPIIQMNEKAELSENAPDIINAIFDNSIRYKGKNDIDLRIKAFSEMCANRKAPFWSSIKKMMPEFSFEEIKNLYFNSVETIVEESAKVVSDFNRVSNYENMDQQYKDIFVEYTRLRNGFLGKSKEQVELD